MAQPRTRDLVWIETLEQLLREADVGTNSVTPRFLADECDVSERTARDTLKVMASRGLVEEDRLPDGRVRFVPAGLLDVEG